MRNYPCPKINETGTTDPGAANDISQGYEVASIWVNTVTPSIWMCASNARGAARWLSVGGSGAMSAGTMWLYKAKTTATSGYPADGYMLWNNATQTSATSLIFAHLTTDGLDIDVLLATLQVGMTLIVQDANDSANFQKWTINGSPTNTNPGTATSYWTVPVTPGSSPASGGTGTTGFANNHQLVVFVVRSVSGAGTQWRIIGQGG